jgi:monooxygenase
VVAVRHSVPLRPRYLRIAGLRVSYVDTGSGPVVLLLHGLGHSIHGWRKNIDPLARAGYRVMAIDLPGFGFSDSPEQYSLELYTTLLRDWLDLHCIDRAAVVGNSMGGLITASFAGIAPDRVAAAVLVDPAGFGREQSLLFRLAAGLAPATVRIFIRQKATERRVRRGLRYVYANPALIEDEEVAHILEYASQPRFRHAIATIGRRSTGLRGMRPALGLGDLPEAIDVPTLVLWGDRDRLVPVSHAEAVRALVSNAELTVFENCGHCPMMEVPDAFNARVLQFLASHLPADGGG